MKRIEIPHGLFAIVDDDDYEELSQYKWHITHGGYVQRHKGKTCVYMHREIMGNPAGLQIDHKNGNKLDNQRGNLRTCIQSQNQANNEYKPSKSGFRGVRWHVLCKRWEAYITNNYKFIHIGNFDNVIDAAHARDSRAIEIYGEFATLNFPRGNESNKG